jgi:transposase
MRSVALDLGANEITYCEVKSGKVVARRTVRKLEALSDLIGRNTQKARVAIEASREAWFVHDLLRAWGHEPALVDTTRIKEAGVGTHKRKNDRRDAEALARALERGTLYFANVLSPHNRQLRYQLGVRRALVETRAQYATTIRGLSRAHGIRLPSCESANLAARARELRLGEDLRALMTPLLVVMEQLNQQIATVDAKLEKLCAEEPAVVQLSTTPSVSLIVAAAFISVIDHPHRFSSAHEVAAYLGLVPSEKSTGGRQRLGGITKHGNNYLRALLVQSAWNLMRKKPHQDPLACWAHAVAQRRGRRVAVIALARRLSGVLWAMWSKGTVYEPGRVGLASARGVQLAAQSQQLQAAAIAHAAKKLSRRSKTSPNRTSEATSSN